MKVLGHSESRTCPTSSLLGTILRMTLSVFLTLSRISIVRNYIDMGDRRRWPTAAYFHTQHPDYEGEHTSSTYREPLPNHVEAIASQEQQSRNPNQVLSVGERIRELYWSTLQFQDDEEVSWDFDRLLGFGSFGVAASYQKRDFHGKVIDVCISCPFAVRSLHEEGSRCKIRNTPERFSCQPSPYGDWPRGVLSRAAQSTKLRSNCRASWIQVSERQSVSR